MLGSAGEPGVSVREDVFGAEDEAATERAPALVRRIAVAGGETGNAGLTPSRPD
jgi:hypothetical protein